MRSVFNLKSRNCIEWTVCPQPTRHFRILSKKFRLEGVKTNFLYLKSGACFLFCESESPLKTTVDIRVSLTSAHCQSLFRKTRFTGRKTEIWSSSNLGYQGSFTFEIIILSDTLKGNQPEASTSGSSVLDECRPHSYLKKTVHFQAACRDFSKLYGDTSSCDVVIKCEDKTFKVHKIVLQTRSKVFDAMLKSDMAEGKTGMVNVKEIKNSTLECFLKYLYSATLPILTIASAKELYKAADQYDVEELKLACSEFMIKILSDQNVCGLLVLADLHNDKELREKAINYIVQKKIPEHDRNWSDFCKIHCSLANEVLNLYIKTHCSK